MPVTSSRRHKTPGVVYTPAPIVRRLLSHTLEERLRRPNFLAASPLRVLDPACGDGAFLIQVAQRMLDAYATPEHRATAHAGMGCEDHGEWRLAIVRRHVFGVDIDAHAVATARRRLAALALGCEPAARLTDGEDLRLQRAADSLRHNLPCGDALMRSPEIPWLRTGDFDVIVSNPPYVGARRLAHRRGADRLRKEDTTAGGDLYVRFVERILELLAEGGHFGVVVPNKIAVTDYARPCREQLLTQACLERVDDISALGAFPGVSVYPILLCGRKSPAMAESRVTVAQPTTLEELAETCATWTLPLASISAREGFPLRRPLDVETRVTTRPLGEMAALHSGATGFAARRVAEALGEQAEVAAPAWDFITSGNIDRYAIRTGGVRFMGRVYHRPVLPWDAECLSERKRRLYREPKIVLSGMSRRLEAAWRETGLALGVQVYAAAELRDDPHYILALLNSKLLAYLFRTRFQAKRLAGGYLSLNKGQLAKLPVRVVRRSEQKLWSMRQELIGLARRLSEGDNPADEWEALDRRADALVYRLYALTDEEMARVESGLEERRGLA